MQPEEDENFVPQWMKILAGAKEKSWSDYDLDREKRRYESMKQDNISKMNRIAIWNEQNYLLSKIPHKLDYDVELNKKRRLEAIPSFDPSDNWILSRKKSKFDSTPYPETWFQKFEDIVHGPTFQEKDIIYENDDMESSPPRADAPVLGNFLEQQHMNPVSAQDYVDRAAARYRARPLIKKAIREARAQYRANLANPASEEYQAKLARMVLYGGRKRKRYYRRRYKRRYGRRRRWYGRGDYRASAGLNAGGRLGGYLGATAGEYLGNTVGRAIGLGDYNVRSNVLAGRLPEVTNTAGNGGTIIRYQEYLGDIVTSATANTFKIDTYYLNPANSKTFPWLSQIAANYEQYEFQGVIFYFRSTSANALNSTNTALGTVMMATQYDTVDPSFSSKMEMLNYEFSTSCVPSADQPHMIECDPHQTTISLMYTEPGEQSPPNTDPRLYFLGKMSIATTGFQGTSVNIGELHVTYQVKLLKPKLNDALSFNVPTYYMTTGPQAFTIFNSSSPLGVIGLIPPPQINTIELIRNPNSLVFPASNVPKQYYVDMNWIGDVNTAGLAYPLPTPVNGILIGDRLQGPQNTGGGFRCSQGFLVRSFGGVTPVLTVNFGTCTLPTINGSGNANLTIIVTEVPVF